MKIEAVESRVITGYTLHVSPEELEVIHALTGSSNGSGHYAGINSIIYNKIADVIGTFNKSGNKAVAALVQNPRWRG